MIDEPKALRNWRERIEALQERIKAMAAAALSNTSTFHAPVVAVATVNFAALAGLLVVDGVATVEGSRVLLANQATPSQNGIWVTHAGAWTRPSDWATGTTRVEGEVINVADGGATFGRFGACWRMTTAAVVDAAGGTPIFFPRFDKGVTPAMVAGVNTQADRWIFAGAQATANKVTDVAATTGINVTAVTMGAGTGQANGTLTVRGAAADVDIVRFVITNF